MIKRKDIIDAVKKLENLPSLNSSVLRMQDKLNDPEADVDFKEMASIIERDIGLSAKILCIANSAAYTGRYGRIGDLEQAISRLGIKQVCKLFLTFNSMQLFPKASTLIDLGEFWKHSISVAMVLRAIVDKAKKTDYNDSNGYMAGLLHDIGILILDQHFGKAYENVRATATDFNKEVFEVEREMLGIDHGEVGGLLLERWMFPEDIIDAVRYHHYPAACPEKHHLFARRLHLADFACAALGALEPGGMMPQQCDFNAWDEIGCDMETLDALIKSGEEEIARSGSFIENGM